MPREICFDENLILKAVPSTPEAERQKDSMGKIGLTKIASIVVGFCVASAIASSAQTFTRLTKFNGSNGQWPYYGSLIQGTDGNFWGTTSFGGNGSKGGTVFQITPNGKLITVCSFGAGGGCPNGSVPYAGLIQDVEGNFYGTTYEGGSQGFGDVFEITTEGQYVELHSFCSEPNCTDGQSASQGLIQAMNGKLYGIASGAIFTLNADNGFTSLFAGEDAPRQMIQASDGNFYGIGVKGSHKGGDVLEITASGMGRTMYNFCSESNCGDGEQPIALMEGADGNFYGTTTYGGASNSGVVFKITPGGDYSVLYSFCSQANCADGGGPSAGLVQGTDGNFYGTTTFGGAVKINGIFGGYGTVFQITPAGQLTTLHTFCLQGGDCADGAYPFAALVQGTDGDFYGTTYGLVNCPGNCGTVFRISMGLSPFVTANPNFAPVGHIVNILGSHFTGTTSVTFHGTSATYDVVSNTLIKATVPSGATAGSIEVTTPGGTLSSNAPFQVLP